MHKIYFEKRCIIICSPEEEALDKVVDGLVDASNGKMPEGFDAQQWMK